MLNTKSIIRGISMFFVVYFGLTLLHMIPAVKNLHDSIFIKLEEFTFNTFHPRLQAEISSEKVDQSLIDQDMIVKLYDKGEYKSVKAYNATRRTGGKTLEEKQVIGFEGKRIYLLPILFFISLVLVTPISWKRKLLVMIVGLFLVYILLAMKLTGIIQGGNENKFNSFWISISKFMGSNSTYTEIVYLMVFNIWLILSVLIGKYRPMKWIFDKKEE